MIPLDLPPGVMQKRAKTFKSSNWREVNLVRWEEDTLYPVGGWEKLTFNIPFASRVRKIHRWTDNFNVDHTAYLCEKHVYVETEGTLTDISPIPALVDPYGSGGYEEGGYGDGVYGASTYGTSRDTRPRSRPYTPSYSIGNWGQELRVMTSADGRYLKWAPGDVRCTVVATAPTNNRGFAITPERHVIIWGVAGNFANTGWCSQEDDTDWNFADPLNTAGDLPIEPKSVVITGVLMGSDLALFTADGRMIIMEYIGTPYIYNMNPKGKTAVPYSADAVMPIPGGCVWMAESGFWWYDGVTPQPMRCEVWDWVTANRSDFYARYEATAVDVGVKSEGWFFFPDEDSQYNTRYVMLDYRQGYIWAMGQIGRSAGFSYPNTGNPIMANGTSVYRHESGLVYDDYDGFPFMETFTINAESGTIKSTLKQLFVEVDGDHSVLRYSVWKANSRLKDSEVQSSLRSMRSNGYVDIRETARDLRLRIEAVAEPTEMWSYGQTLIDIVARGQK